MYCYFINNVNERENLFFRKFRHRSPKKRRGAMPKRISFLRFLSTLHSLASQLNITATPERSVTHFHPCFTVTISLWKLP